MRFLHYLQCMDIPISTEMFVNVIKATSHIEELDAIRTLVCREMADLRSRDSGGREEGTEVKQQINSLDFLRRIIDARINRLDKGADTDSNGVLVPTLEKMSFDANILTSRLNFYRN